MARPWKHRLALGSDLRRAIDDGLDGREESAKVLDLLRASCREVMEWAQHAPEYGDEWDAHYAPYAQFEELYELLDGEADVVRTQPEIIVTEWGMLGGVTELVNDRLAQFYDLCDTHRVWVEF